MSKADKKQKQKLKRKAKKQELRRRDAISPIKRLAEAPGEVECFIGGDLLSHGQVQIQAFKRGGGVTGVVAFLIDRGVVGLKDAYFRANIDRSEFHETLEVASSRGLTLQRVDITKARQLVAGGARWAHDNGMRLPKDWLKTAAVIGGVGDWMNADVSKFSREFHGHPGDLRQRLIGEPFDTYVQRNDIEFLFSSDAPYSGVSLDHEYDDIDEEDDGLESIISQYSPEEIDAHLAPLHDRMRQLVEETTRFVSRRGEVASTVLSTGYASFLLSSMVLSQAGPDEKLNDVEQRAVGVMKALRDSIKPEIMDEYDKAIEQIKMFLSENPKALDSIADATPEAEVHPMIDVRDTGGGHIASG